MMQATIATPAPRTERMIASEGLRAGYRRVTRESHCGLRSSRALLAAACTVAVVSAHGSGAQRGSRAMKLHQLRYLAAVAQSGLNITAAAQKLHTSQPGVSKQIKLLEDELGFQIFVREGRNLTRITPAGQQVIERALKILQEAQSIRDLSTELRDEGKGSLSIGTTHTQARYVLPDVIREFRGRYPNVRLNLHQGTSEQIAEMVAHDRIDCAVATGSEHLFADLTLLPCYRWHRTVIVPKDHPLASGGRRTLRALFPQPLVPRMRWLW